MNSTRALSAPVLSDAQLESFKANGFVIARIFDETDLDPIRAVITRWIDHRIENLRLEGRHLEPHPEASFEQRAARMLEQYGDFFKGFDLHGLLEPEVFEHLCHPRMLAAVSQILGEGISLNPVMHVRIKAPSSTSGFDNVPWHQDAGVYTEDTDGTTILTCWRPIGEATVEMGCMELIPGVEGPEPLPHGSSPYGTAILPEAMPKRKAVPAPCRPGDVVIMHQYTPHRSTPNLSDKCRWSMDIRYHVKGVPSGRNWQPEAPLTGPDAWSYETWSEAWKTCIKEGRMQTRHRVVKK